MSFLAAINPFTVAMTAVAGIFLAALGIVVMHVLTPKQLIEKYFRPPYFSITEPAYFVGRVYSINFTVMFMGLTAFPRLGKKRKLTEMYKEVPNWYRIASRIVLIFMFSCGFVLFGVLLVYGSS